MTPREKYGHEVTDDVIIHELGHAIAGHEIGIVEGGIELCDPATGEVARAHYSTNGTTARKRIVRGLAGAYTQTRVNPKALPEGLSEQILRGSIFINYAAEIDSGSVPQLVKEAGLYGDWERIVSEARETAQEIDAIISELRSAHQDLALIYDNRRIEQKVSHAKRDFQMWLDQHDEDVPFMERLFYPIGRLSAVLEQEKDG